MMRNVNFFPIPTANWRAIYPTQLIYPRLTITYYYLLLLTITYYYLLVDHTHRRDQTTRLKQLTPRLFKIIHYQLVADR